jgi:uncharacterized phage protein (TIGR01671 family)
MREIKFNAVDEDTGEYVRYNRWLNKVYNEDNTDNEHLSSFLEFYFGYKLLQYTGLKDKNGVEVYDGDIWYDDQDNHIGKISYDMATFICVSVKDGFESQREERFVGVDEVNALGERIAFGNLEVIGNIYENRELLEKK